MAQLHYGAIFEGLIFINCILNKDFYTKGIYTMIVKDYMCTSCDVISVQRWNMYTNCQTFDKYDNKAHRKK